MKIKQALPLLALLACWGCTSRPAPPKTPPMPARALPKSLAVPLAIPGPPAPLAVNIEVQSSTNLNDWIPVTTFGFTLSPDYPRSAFRALMSINTYKNSPPPVSVLTYHNDGYRSGLNARETKLNTVNVNTNGFGKLFECNVDGYIYGQPLYVPNLNGTNVVFVVSEGGTVYAFNADSGALVWSNNLAPPMFEGDPGTAMWFSPKAGITSTPVIDLKSGRLYACTYIYIGWKLAALDITNGANIAQTIVSATFPGAGMESTNGIIGFDGRRHLQRSAITLAGGVLYLAFCGWADADPYHGWVIAFDPDSLAQTGAFCVTPSWGDGGIWMSGNGLCVDDDTNLFMVTGNGTFNPGTDYSESVVKLSGKEQVLDYFTPSNQQELTLEDGDFGSGGAMLLPEAAGSPAHPHLMVACGKYGVLYLLDRDHLGGYDTNETQAVQYLVQAGSGYGAWSSPAYFNGQVFYHTPYSVCKVYSVSNAVMALDKSGPVKFNYPGATPSISANGTNDAILWEVQGDRVDNLGNIDMSPQTQAVLHAFRISDMVELYNSNMNTNDSLGTSVKFAVPTVVNGKVYVGTTNKLAVFGLKP